MNVKPQNLCIVGIEAERMRYWRVKHQLARLPKVFLQDVLLFGLTFYLISSLLEKAPESALWSATIAGVQLIRSFFKMKRYVFALRRYKRYLLSVPSRAHEYKSADRRLRALDRVCLRRLLTLGVSKPADVTVDLERTGADEGLEDHELFMMDDDCPDESKKISWWLWPGGAK